MPRRSADPSALFAPRPHPDFATEEEWRRRGANLVAGVDEAGRGPLAGPVVAAAVVLDAAAIPAGLNDSKKLSANARERVFASVLVQALAIGVGSASAAEIDRVNIRQATFLAMRRAVAALPVVPDRLIVDGNDMPPEFASRGTWLIGGDARSLSIAAASIVAKVLRDRTMMRLGAAFPVYGFAQHMGYGTRAHLGAIAAHGPSSHHRLSFAPLRSA